MQQKRIGYYDVLKGIAIIAVVLYHLGVCGYGYLGVDIFLVIAGYFTARSMNKCDISIGGGYKRLLLSRLYRLWPLLAIAGAICLVWGYFLMLPDDYENTVQSIVATNFFGNNILQAITTKNYWDVSNEYKPLMHTWYVGLLMQYYVFIIVIGWLTQKFSGKNRKRVVIVITSIIAVVSLLLYLFFGSPADKFYFLQYRLFEFAAGMLVFYLLFKKDQEPRESNRWNVLFLVIYGCLLALLFVDVSFIKNQVRLLLVVGLTSLLLWTMPKFKIAGDAFFLNTWLAAIGRCSYSIFVWHQLVFALTRYSFTNNLTAVIPLMIITAIIAMLTILSYRFIEKVPHNNAICVSTVALILLTTVGSLKVYKDAGVVRNIPELDVKKSDAHRGMWAEYCDRGYKYDREFSNDSRSKWYVIGNSFGRDMVNIISESPIANKVDLIYSDNHSFEAHPERFAQADIVIASSLGGEEYIVKIQSLCSSHSRFYVVGEKNFGTCNGQIYRQRGSMDYHNLTAEMEDGYADRNLERKRMYAESFIDLISLVQQPDGRVLVFTEDGRFISQDCRHLTQAGAQYYARLIDWGSFGMKNDN